MKKRKSLRLLAFLLVIVMISIITLISLTEYSIASDEQIISIEGNNSVDPYATVRYGNYLYAACGVEGVQIYDVSDVKNPTNVTPNNATLQRETMDTGGAICENNGYLYVAFKEDILKFTLANPAEPVLVATFNSDSTLDMVISGSWLFAGTSGNRGRVYNISVPDDAPTYERNRAALFIADGITSLAVSGDVLYATLGMKLYAVDISNPADMDLNNTIENGKYSLGVLEIQGGNLDGLKVIGRHLYCSDKGNNKNYKIDISNPANISRTENLIEVYDGGVEVSTYKDYMCTAVCGYKNYLYLSAKENGIKIIDVSVPEEPRDVTQIDNEGLIGQMPNVGNGGIIVNGDFLYSIFGNGEYEIRKFSLTNPKNPELVATFIAGTVQPTILAVAGNYLFAAQDGENQCYKWLNTDETSGEVSSIEESLFPSVPVNVEVFKTWGNYLLALDGGSFRAYSQTSVSPMVGFNFSSDVKAMDCTKGYLYLFGDEKLYVADITESPTNIKLLAKNRTYDCAEIKNIQSCFSDGNYLYAFGEENNLCIFDITSPREPELLSSNIAINAKAGCLLNNYLYAVSSVEDGTKLARVNLSEKHYPTKYFSLENLTDDKKDNSIIEKIVLDRFGKEDEPAVIIEAVYKDGKLFDCNKKNVLLKENIRDYEYYFDLSDNSKAQIDGNYEVKVFAWNKDYLTPILPSRTFVVTGGETEVTRLTAYDKFFSLLKLSPMEYKSQFSDVTADYWYADEIQALRELKLLHDNGQYLEPHEKITREELAYLAYNSYKLFLGVPTFNNVDSSASEEISQWAKEAVNASVSIGLMPLNADGNFNPQGTVTYSQMMKVVSNLKKEFSDNSLDVDALPWKQAPIIFKVSDEIKPGEAFHLYGYGLNNAKIYAEKAETLNDLPTEQCTELEVLQYDDEGQYICATLTSTLPGGVYKIWAENDYGLSKVVYLNGATATWVDMDCGYEGLELRLIGRNFLPERFGANEEQTKVRLTNTSGSYEMENVQVEPYAVKFKIPEGVPVGEYDISVTNDGLIWNTLENEQNFKVWEKGNDPLELGVAWEKNYVYDKTYNVKDYGAKGDGVSDDTEAVQRALNASGDNGGGIVYFPVGNYRIEQMEIPAYTILQGESRDDTKIIMTLDDSTATFMWTRTDAHEIGYQGITNLTFTMDEQNPNQKQPAFILKIGKVNANNEYVYSHDMRGYEGFFMTKVTVDFPLEYRGSVLQSSAVADKYFLYSDCNFTGFRAFCHSNVLKYQRQTNNVYHTIASSLSNNGSYSVFENNIIKLESEYKDEDGNTYYAQGITLRSDSYVAHNKIYNTGATGATDDGEVILTEFLQGGTIKIIGDVLDATIDTIKVQPYRDENGNIYDQYNYWDREIVQGRWGRLYALITGGKGAGQYREVTELVNDSYTISKPWDIIPDATSRVVIANYCTNVVVYNNYAENCEKGIWFYGGDINSIIADNEGINTDGVYCIGFDQDKNGYDNGGWRMAPEYFITIKGNTFDGEARHRETSGILFPAAFNNQSSEVTGYSVFGTMIKDNTIKNSSNNGAISLTAICNGTYAPDSTIHKASIVEGNSFENTKYGIVVGKSIGGRHGAGAVSGVVIKNNQYKDVVNPYLNYEADNVLHIDN